MPVTPIHTLLTQLYDAHISCRVEDGTLRLQGPPAALQGELLDALRANKQALIDYLTQQTGPDTATPRQRPDDAPAWLSFPQQRMWFFEQIEHTGVPAYHIPCALRLRGPLHLNQLYRALSGIIARHEALRTRFVTQDDEPRQVIDPPQPLAPRLIDLSGLDQPEEARARIAAEEAAAVFDLAQGPLYRCRLLRLAADHHVLLFTMHHIVFDGWSVGLFIRELSAGYGGADTPKPTLQYGDFAWWQRHYQNADALHPQRDYWLRHLSGMPPLLPVPTDKPRPARQTFNGAVHPMTIDKKRLVALTHLSRTHSATLFMTLQATFAVLLHRYTGHIDVPVGTPIANRTRPAWEGLIGCFINTLCLRNNLSGNPHFAQLLQRTRALTMDAFANQDLPFEQVVDAVQPERNPGHSPLFQVMFVLQNAPNAALTLPGLDLDLLPLENMPALQDLALQITEKGETYQGDWVYRTDLFKATTIARMSNHFLQLIDQICAEPNTPIDAIQMLTPSEKEQLLVGFNQTTHPAFTAPLIHHMVARQVIATPHPVAVCSAEAGPLLTYAALDQRANQLAHRLRRRGIGPEHIVGVTGRRSPALVVAKLAVLKAGAAYLPLDPNQPAERNALYLSDSNAALLLTDDAATPPPFNGETWQYQPGHSAAFSTEPPPEVGRNQNLAYVIYTSGSTGKPKGVCIAHVGIQRMFLGNLAYTPDSVTLQMGPIAFDSSVFDIWGTLSGGGRLVCWPGRFPELGMLARVLAAHYINRLIITSSTLHTILDEDPEMLQGVRLILTGAEVLSPQHVRFAAKALPRTTIINGYGPTECTVTATGYPVPPDFPEQAETVPIGKPHPETRIYLMDVGLRPVPQGVWGELCMAGPSLGRGYLNQPGETARHFVPDPNGAAGERLYRTGDLARLITDPTGHELVLDFGGRFDTQVKLRGQRIELGEIENRLNALTGVADAVVVMTASRGELSAFLVAEPHVDLDPAVLRDYLARQLPDYMLPTAWAVLPTLPKTINDKLDRAALTRYQGPFVGTGRQQDDQPPVTPIQKQLAAIWMDLLDLDKVGIHTSFFECGGHSLMAARLISRIRTHLGVDLPIRTVFEAPTIAELANCLNNPTQAALPPITPLVPSEPAPLSFGQQRFWFFHELAGPEDAHAYNMPVALDLKGALDVPLLEGALRTVIDRHPTLRTRFPAVGGEAKRLCDPPGGFRLSLIDLRHTPSTAHTLIAREEKVPFNLASDDLFRAKLLRLDQDTHILVATMHHIITDGWSMGVFVNELSTCYGAMVAGETPSLPPLPIHYRDYAAWQHRMMTDGFLDSPKSYWQQQLAEAPELLTLPLDMPRGPVQTFDGAYRRFQLDMTQRRAVEAMASETGSTPFIVLYAVFCLLLARYSGQRDIVVGTPVANRNQQVLEPLIGLLINSLPLRLRLDGYPTFYQVMTRARQTALEAFANSELPFDQIVALADVPRNLTHSPVFQTLFALQNAPLQPLDLPGLALTPRDPQELPASQDVSLNFWEDPDGLRGYLIYNRRLFKPATAARMIHHYEMLLQAVLDHPERPIDTIPLVDDQTLQALRAFGQGVTVGLHTIHSRIEILAERHPDQMVLTQVDGCSLTFGALNDRADRLARVLRERGTHTESIVALFLHRGLDLAVAQLAVLKCGAAFLPLDPHLSAERSVWMMDDAGAALLLTRSDVTALLPEHETHHLLLDQLDLEGVSPLPALSVDPYQTAYVIYTSGSTGRPKGVRNHHAALARFGNDPTGHRAVAHSRILQVASCAFDASVWEIWSAALNGGHVTFYPNRYLEPEKLGTLFTNHYIDRIMLVPANLDMVLSEAPQILQHLSRLDTGADAFSPDTARRVLEVAPGIQLLNAYGPTEAGVIATYHQVGPRDAEHCGHAVAIGRSLSNTQTWLMDRYLNLTPPGVPGELCLGGPSLARDYHKRPALTAEKFVPHPFATQPGERLYRTGDLIKLADDDHGRPDRFIFLGRIDHQVKLRGYRIELGEIENALRDLPAVDQAVVLLRRNPDVLVGHVVLRDKGYRNPEALSDQLKDRLPDYMIPGIWDVRDSLPLNRNQKIDRNALAAKKLTVAASHHRRPETPTQAIVARIWFEVLGHDGGIHDNFFEIGGHSLSATRVVARLRDACKIDLETRDLFTHPTIAGLAGLLEGREPDADTIKPMPSDEEPQLSFAQTRLWFLDQLAEGAQAAAFNMPLALRVTGPLDLTALQDALTSIAQRHAVLLSAMPEQEGRPRLVFNPDLSPMLRLIDLTHLSTDAMARADALSHHEQARPFNLTTGPLCRVTCLRLAHNTHRLLLTLHHIIADGLSMALLAHELPHSYNARVHDTTPIHLPLLPVNYADFARWQRERMANGHLTRQLDYWQDKLAGPLPLLDLPVRREPEAAQDMTGATQAMVLSPQLSAQLHHLATTHKTTLFTVLLTVFKMVLQRWSGQSDLVVGTPVAGRPQTSLEPLIGLFLNSLALRDDLSGNPTFVALLERVGETVRGGFANQDVPFERLVEAVNPERRMDRHPLYDVVLNLIEPPAEDLGMAGLQTRVQQSEPPASKLFLTLFVQDVAGDITLRPVYRKALFRGEQISCMLARFHTLLEQISADPTLPIDTYSTIPTQAVPLLPHTTFPLTPPDTAPLVPTVYHLAQQEPERIAVITDHDRFTYAQVMEAAEGIRRLLRRRDLQPGEVVAVYGLRCFGLVTALTAVLAEEVVLLTLDPALPWARRRAMLDMAEARCLIEVGTRMDEWNGQPPIFVDTSGQLAEAFPGDSPLPPPVADGAYIVFTSGTTGKPKGVWGSRKALAQFFTWEASCFGIGPGDLTAQTSTAGVDMIFRDIFLPLTTGGAVVIPPGGETPDGPSMPDWLNQQQITVLHSIASIAATWLTGDAPFPHLRRLFLTGEPLRDDTVRHWQRRFTGKIINLYGATETCLARTWEEVSKPPIPGNQSVGRPLPGVRILVRAGERPCGLDEVGEIYLALPFSSKGYLALPEETAFRFPSHPYGSEHSLYRTGDLGRIAPDGRLHVLGREDRQIKIRGVRIEPGDIEAALETHAEIGEAVVLPTTNARGGISLAAFIATKADTLTPEPARYLLDRLPTAMIPAVILTLPELPRLATGKPDRQALYDRLSAEETTHHPRLPLSTPTQNALAQIWTEVLDLPVDHADSDFFVLGGHSLLAAQVAARCRETFHLEIPLRVLFENKTLSALAAHIDDLLLAVEIGKPQETDEDDTEDFTI